MKVRPLVQHKIEPFYRACFPKAVEYRGEVYCIKHCPIVIEQPRVHPETQKELKFIYDVSTFTIQPQCCVCGYRPKVDLVEETFTFSLPKKTLKKYMKSWIAEE